MPSSFQRRLPAFLLVGSLAGLAALVLLTSLAPFLQRIEHQTADWRTAVLADRVANVHPHVAVVLITEKTLRDYPYLLPPDRGMLARVVSALDAAGAKAIGLDFYFARRTEPAKDSELTTALREAKAAVVIGAIDERGRLSDTQQSIQRAFLAESGRPSGFINLRSEPDGIVRFRAEPAGGQFPSSFASLVAEQSGLGARPVEGPIAWLRSGTAQPFLTLDAEALLADTAANREAVAAGTIAALNGKAVIVGGDIAYLDRHATPISGKGSGAMPGVFVHAQDVAQRLDGRRLSELDTGSVRLMLAAVAAAAAVLGWSFGVRHYNFVGWTAATAVLVAVDVLVFAQLRTILPFSLMLGAWVLGATAGRSLRLMMAGANKGERHA